MRWRFSLDSHGGKCSDRQEERKNLFIFLNLTGSRVDEWRVGVGCCAWGCFGVVYKRKSLAALGQQGFG
jgi:hypothetical protein